MNLTYKSDSERNKERCRDFARGWEWGPNGGRASASSVIVARVPSHFPLHFPLQRCLRLRTVVSRSPIWPERYSILCTQDSRLFRLICGELCFEPVCSSLFLVAILVPFSGLQGLKLPSLNLPCSHAGLVMKAFAVMLQWSQSIGTLNVHGRPSWQCWLSTRGREDDQGNALETTCGSMDGFAQHLEFMAMWRWETVLNEFLNWSLKMLLVMCC